MSACEREPACASSLAAGLARSLADWPLGGAPRSDRRSLGLGAAGCGDSGRRLGTAGHRGGGRDWVPRLLLSLSLTAPARTPTPRRRGTGATEPVTRALCTPLSFPTFPPGPTPVPRLPSPARSPVACPLHPRPSPGSAGLLELPTPGRAQARPRRGPRGPISRRTRRSGRALDTKCQCRPKTGGTPIKTGDSTTQKRSDKEFGQEKIQERMGRRGPPVPSTPPGRRKEAPRQPNQEREETPTENESTGLPDLSGKRRFFSPLPRTGKIKPRRRRR